MATGCATTVACSNEEADGGAWRPLWGRACCVKPCSGRWGLLAPLRGPLHFGLLQIDAGNAASCPGEAWLPELPLAAPCQPVGGGDLSPQTISAGRARWHSSPGGRLGGRGGGRRRQQRGGAGVCPLAQLWCWCLRLWGVRIRLQLLELPLAPAAARFCRAAVVQARARAAPAHPAGAPWLRRSRFQVGPPLHAGSLLVCCDHGMKTRNESARPVAAGHT